jgi:predicted lipid carrier protein YhbT
MDRDELNKKLVDAAFEALRLPFKAAPLWMEAAAVGVYISAVMRAKPELSERFKELGDRLFMFEATDAEKAFYIRFKDGEAKVVPHTLKKPDVIMRGTVKTLAGVLTGRVDPDTVFFSRELEINGDTAAALHLKNILSSL